MNKKLLIILASLVLIVSVLSIVIYTKYTGTLSFCLIDKDCVAERACCSYQCNNRFTTVYYECPEICKIGFDILLPECSCNNFRCSEKNSKPLTQENMQKTQVEIIRGEIDVSSYCTTKEDCVNVGTKCPFGCDILVNKEKAELIKDLLDSYEVPCFYDCIGLVDYDCIENKCKAIYE